MITGIVQSERPSPNSIEVFWTIGQLGKKLEEDHILQSVPFSFAGQMWRQLLTAEDTLEDLHIDLSISRVTLSKVEIPAFSVVCWTMGILDSNGRSHYGRTGFASLETDFKEWISVADFSGPEFTHLSLQKDLYMPGDIITIALRLILDSGEALIKDKQDLTPEKKWSLEQNSITSDVIVINVRDRTFYAQSSILGAISETIELQIIESARSEGMKTVIDLPDCDPKAFQYFLSFAYSRTAEVEKYTRKLTDDIAGEVYYIADKFQVPKLKRKCVQHFLSTLNASSVCEVLELAIKYHDQALEKKCSEFFLKNAREILNTSEWLKFMATHTKFANDLIISYMNSTAG